MLDYAVLHRRNEEDTTTLNGIQGLALQLCTLHEGALVLLDEYVICNDSSNGFNEIMLLIHSVPPSVEQPAIG